MNSNPCPDTVTPLLPWPGWIRRNQLELSELLRMFEATFASSPPWPITGISVGTLLRLSRLGSPSREAWSSGRRSGSPAPAPTPAPAELSTSAVETPRSPPLYSTRGLKCRALRKPRLSLPLDSVAIAEAQIPPVVPTGASRLSWRSPWDSAGMAEAETPEHSKMPALEPVLPAWAVSLFSTCFHPDPLEFEPQVASVQVDLAKTLESLQLEEKFGESYLYFRKLMQSALGADNEMLLQTKDISHFLMKDIAFLSGGRSKDNAWIITFPENCDFRCISEEKITKVLTYLTCIARKNGSDSRFIVILDRRSDTWSSTKISLQKISVSFPGNLHLVLVLRPTSFLQRTFTDIGLWFSHEDFMLKLPVVMLSSVSDLLTYIDAKQLTPELGGTLQYCHSEWILFTNAIEKFARSVKDVAYMLKSFGTELAETELPYDIPTIEDILLSRAARYRLLKNDITAITKEGTILLSNLRFPDTAVSASSAIERRQEISGDWQSINKLLTQVHDMETAFDGFWMKHKEKMDQYVQLWKFEQDFQEFTTEIQMSVNNLSEVADATGNISEVKQKLKIMDNIEESSKDLLSKARFLVLHGHKLAANHHFALDFIYQRSNEVRHLTDVMLKEMKTKRIQLNRTFKMHKLLQQAWQCCDEGESLLINGGKDRFQSEEDVQRALQDIENFLTVALPFIQYEGESLQREFDVVLSPELKMQMQAVQVKLENIRVIFERQQNMTGALTDKCGKPTQLQGSETEPLIQSITPSFSPKYAGIGYSFFQACKLFSKGKKTYRPTQSNVKVEGIPQIEKKDSVSQSCTLATDNNLDILKNHVLNELIQTETLYVQELFSVLSGYRAEMENPDMFHFIPTPLRDKKDILFGNMPEIYEFHKNIFISSLENCRRFPELVGQCFLERKNDFLQMYAKYCQNKPRSEQLWKNYSECAFFQICQRKLKHRLSLDSYLLKPVQRITKYQLLLKELLKYTFDIRGSEPLRQALDTILELLKSVNDSMHQVAITGFMGNLSDLGKMILQGPFNVWLGHRRGSTKMKDFARFKPMQRHLFLYEKAIVFCKRRESGERSERYPSYTFKRYLQMENVGITEFVKGDARKFEICSGEKEEVYTLQPPNLEMKTIWLKEIQTILAKQQELLTVTVQKEETQVPNQDPFASQQKSNIEQQGDFKSTGAARAGTPVNDSQATVQAEAEASSAVCTDMPQSSETPEGSQEWSAEHDLEDMPLLEYLQQSRPCVPYQGEKKRIWKGVPFWPQFTS